MPSYFRQLRWYDHLFIGISQCLTMKPFHPDASHSEHTSDSSHEENMVNPSQEMPEHSLSLKEKKLSGALMRINHSGEICAQALYLGQSMTAKQSHIIKAFKLAAMEETLHLKWCEERLKELNTHTSYLNPLWFTGALIIGTGVGFLGDKWSLGFLAETENQVFTHLGKHLAKLPASDLKSRAIVKQMQLDEAKHAATAFDLGAKRLPAPIKFTMKNLAQIMTTVTFYI